ncbi:type II toxin-antitoxin system VapC family toxin [Larkinella sp. GY13]|uniref:type II toxin-antitoxin system VapC family toxin n=1 Tax=Larkinella sp. GY13 TaxID=3453720 RepID=UPI003EEF652F
MAKRVVIDSQVFLWGVREVPTEGLEDLIPRTKALFEYLINNGYEIILPAPVLGEILITIPSSERDDEISNLSKLFTIYHFDASVAKVFAGMMERYLKEKDKKSITLLSNGKELTKGRIKFDYLICAIAVCAKAECVYSLDPDFPKFVADYILVKDIPPLPKQKPERAQLSLFQPQEIKHEGRSTT